MGGSTVEGRTYLKTKLVYLKTKPKINVLSTEHIALKELIRKTNNTSNKQQATTHEQRQQFNPEDDDVLV